MSVIKIDNIDYHIPIINYEIDPQILDGEATARTASVGWEMFRDPQGTIINLNVTFGLLNTNNPNFVKLFNKIMHMGITKFVSVTFDIPAGVVITQDMYIVPDKIIMIKKIKDGITYWGQWPVKFIAKRAYNV